MIISRRNFLPFGVGAVQIFGQELEAIETVERTSHALGSKIQLKVRHADKELAGNAIIDAFREIRRVDSLMSLYRLDSQISRLNHKGELANPHPWLVKVLKVAEGISQQSEGDFDITVQPLWKLYSEAKKAGRIPSKGEVEAARAKVGWQQVEIKKSRIRLHGEGTAITLNALAQGFAADVALATLRGHGIQHALVDTGEFAGMGRSAKGTPWKVGIQHPRQEDAFVAVASLDARCLSTTGDYATKFTDDFAYNHIFQPSTGKSPDELASVSVCAPTAMIADGLSTTFSVTGVKRGMEMLRKHPGVDALFVLKSGRLLATKDFPMQNNPK